MNILSPRPLRQKLLGDFILCAASIALLMLAAEVLFRFFDIGYGSAPLESDPILHHRHPKNYSFIVYDPNGEFGGHRVVYDDEGFVRDPEISSAHDNVPCQYRVALLGDSATEAIQVPFTKSFFGRMSRSAKSGVCIKNYGVSTYSPIIYSLQWNMIARSYHPTHVFVLLHGSDFWDDIYYSKSARYSEQGELIAITGPGDDMLKKILRKSYLLRFFRKAQLKIEWILNRFFREKEIVERHAAKAADMPLDTARHLLAVARKVKRTDAEFVLMLVPPHQFQGNYPTPGEVSFSDIVRKWAKTHDIRYIDLDEPFSRAAQKGKIFFEIDIHFNERGHQIVYEAIKAEFPELFMN